MKERHPEEARSAISKDAISLRRSQFPRRDLFEVAQSVEQALGCDPRMPGVEAGAEFVEQLHLAQRPLGMAARAPDLFAFDPLAIGEIDRDLVPHRSAAHDGIVILIR